MSFLFTDCVCVSDWEKHREHTDLDSLPGSQLACVALSILPPFLSLPSSPPPNILLSVSSLYKTHTVQTLYLEALCEERKNENLEVPSLLLKLHPAHRQEVRSNICCALSGV